MMKLNGGWVSTRHDLPQVSPRHDVGRVSTRHVGLKSDLQGFTLLELIVVITIIVVLMGLHGGDTLIKVRLVLQNHSYGKGLAGKSRIVLTGEAQGGLQNFEERRNENERSEFR